jgi:hypothetical protein
MFFLKTGARRVRIVLLCGGDQWAADHQEMMDGKRVIMKRTALTVAMSCNFKAFIPK